MKRVLLVLILFLFNSAFAVGNNEKIYLPLIFKSTFESYVNNVAISNDNKKILITNDSKVKIFNKNGDLIKVLNFNNLIKALFSYDNKKILILTKEAFYIYDANSYNEIGYFPHNSYYSFKNLFLKKNLVAVIEDDCCKNKIFIFDTDTNKKVNSFSIKSYVYYGDFSLDLKKLAFSSGDKILVLNLNGDLLTDIPARGKFYEVKWLNKNEIVVHSSNHNIYIFNIKTGNPKVTINNSRIDGIDILDKDNILIFIKNKIKIFNLKKLSFLNKIFMAIGESLNDEIVNFYLSKDKTLLAVAYKSRNVKLFDTSKAFNLNNLKSSKKVTIKSSEVNTKNNDKDKKITNKKPKLFIYASQTKGAAPLKVYFKFLSDDEDGKVISYYVNFLGKEFLGKGDLNKSFVYTFRKAGEYKIMVAVKDDKGAITEKQITINVKEKPEETFEDYKREILGN